jgi:hypothetical protein
MMMKISWYYVHYFTFHCFSFLLFFLHSVCACLNKTWVQFSLG